MEAKRNKQEELEEVTIKCKVPKNIMQFLRDQKFFDSRPEEWYSKAIAGMVSCELSNLDYDEEQRLKKKYRIKEDMLIVMI